MTASPDGVVRRELLRFLIPAAIGMALLLVVSLAVSVAVARQQSLRDATLTAQFLARSVVAPRLDEALVAGRPARLAALDDALASSVAGSDVIGIRVWDADGIIVYADDPRLIGERFPLATVPDPASGPVAGPADPTRPENRYLDPEAEVVDVSLPIAGPDDREYLLQVHQLQDTLQQDARAIWWSFVPVLVGSLLLVALLLGMLAYRMARRIDDDWHVQQSLLRRTVVAGDVERRRIAAQLHDGTVQDLAGLSYTLAGLSARADGRGEAAEAQQLAAAAAQTRDAVRGLRTLLVDIYPANLERTGLAGALADLAAGLAPRMTATVDAADLPDLPASVQSAVYRIAREAVSNVAKHSGARTVTLGLHTEGDQVVLTVDDDGRGFDPRAVADDRLGLHIAADVAAAVGGDLTVTAVPGTGTTVTFRVDPAVAP